MSSATVIREKLSEEGSLSSDMMGRNRPRERQEEQSRQQGSVHE